MVERLFFRPARSRRRSILSALDPSQLSAEGFERGAAAVNALTNETLLTAEFQPIAYRLQAGAPVRRLLASQPPGSYSLQFSLLTLKWSRLAELTLVVSRSDQLMCIAQRMGCSSKPAFDAAKTQV